MAPSLPLAASDPPKNHGDSNLKPENTSFLLFPPPPPLAKSDRSGTVYQYNRPEYLSSFKSQIPPLGDFTANPPFASSVFCPISVHSSSSLSAHAPSPADVLWSSSSSSSSQFLTPSPSSSASMVSTSPALDIGIQTPTAWNMTSLSPVTNQGGAGFGFRTSTGHTYSFLDNPPLSLLSAPGHTAGREAAAAKSSQSGTDMASAQEMSVSWPSAFTAVDSHGAAVWGPDRGSQTRFSPSLEAAGTLVPSFAAAVAVATTSSMTPALSVLVGSAVKSERRGSGGGLLTSFADSSNKGPSTLTLFSPFSSPSPAPPTTAPKSSPEAYAPLLPLKPIKVSTNRYAALAMLDSGRRCNLPSLTSNKKEPCVPKSLRASFSSAAVAEEAVDRGLQHRGKKKGASELGESVGTLSKKRNIQETSGKQEAESADLEGSDEEAWQISVHKKHGNRGKKSWERQRPRTSAATAAQTPRPSRGKGRNSPAGSTPQRGSGGFRTPPFAQKSPQESRSSSGEKTGSSGKGQTYITFEGMTSPGPSQNTSRPRARTARLPSLMSLEVKPHPPPPTPPSPSVEGKQLRLGDSSMPRLDQFSFSKKLVRPGEGPDGPRPLINTGFIGQLVRSQQTTNLSKDGPFSNAHGKGFWKDPKSEACRAIDPTDGKMPCEDCQKVGKTGQDAGPCSQGSGECASATNGSASGKDPPPTHTPKMTAYRKLCLYIAHEFPHLKQEEMVEVIEGVKQTHGGHFNGKLFSDILTDIRTAILQQCPDRLRSVKSEATWQQCSTVSDTSFKAVEEECSICLVEFSSSSSSSSSSSHFPYILDCGHRFHKQCIERWVKAQGERTCPMCRTMVLMCEEFPHLGRPTQPTLQAASQFDKFPHLGRPTPSTLQAASQLDDKEFPHLGRPTPPTLQAASQLDDKEFPHLGRPTPPTLQAASQLDDKEFPHLGVSL
ncbi:hypothetical protein ACOMHN_017008 [Nucella lapillus]